MLLRYGKRAIEDHPVADESQRLASPIRLTTIFGLVHPTHQARGRTSKSSPVARSPLELQDSGDLRSVAR